MGRQRNSRISARPLGLLLAVGAGRHLAAGGIRVLRFTNREILEERQEVLDRVLAATAP